MGVWMGPAVPFAPLRWLCTSPPVLSGEPPPPEDSLCAAHRLMLKTAF